MRHPLVIGNWKLNGTQKFTHELITELHENYGNNKNLHVVIAPPFVYLDQAKELLKKSSIQLAAQNVDTHISGAYTGEISAEMLKDVGVSYVILGHSERRSLHKEEDNTVAEKFALTKAAGLIPILCIGETEAENAAGQTQAICARQIDAIFEKEGENAFFNAVIAYEPVWAIGTGKSATPEQAQSVHTFIRQHIAKKNAEMAEHVHLLYGGSVNETNAKELFMQPDIDGALVGGASLKIAAFSAIIHAANR